MNKEKYPKWIDEFAKSIHNAVINVIPASWSTPDVFKFVSYLNGSFLRKIYQAIIIIKEKGYSEEEIAKSFSCPSTLRWALWLFAIEYQHTQSKDKDQFKEIMEFFVGILKHIMQEDIFSYHSNIAHNSREIKEILETTPWIAADPQITREAGKLYNSSTALAFALYRDFFPQDSHEVYGPYNAESKFGENTILVIKHFPKIHPSELWPELNHKYKDVKIFQIIKGVKFKCDIIGMHTIYEGDIINNTPALAVIINGKFATIDGIKSASQEIAQIATDQFQVYSSMSFDQIKEKLLEWECYQFLNFFELAGIDWKPTKEMIDAIKNKDIGDKTIMETFPPFKEYVNSPEFEIYWLKDLYN